MKHIKNSFFSILATALSCCLLISGCSNSNTKTEEVAAKPQKAISDSGYGRQNYSAAGIPFTVGDTLDSFSKSGFDIEDSKLNQQIDPWGFEKFHAFYEGKKSSFASLSVYVINESDYTQNAKNCRVIAVSGVDDIKGKDLFETGVTTMDEILSKYDPAQKIDVRGLDYCSDYQYMGDELCYGTTFNNIQFGFEGDGKVLSAVQILCCDNVFSEIDYSKFKDTPYFSVKAAASKLSGYFDVSPYLEYKDSLNRRFSKLNDVIKSDTVNLSIGDVSVNFGTNKETYRTLIKKGLELNIKYDDEEFEPHASHGVILNDPNSPYDINFYNESATDSVNWKDAQIDGLELSNPVCVSTRNNEAPLFNFYGITEKSSIKDIISILGAPETVSNIYDHPQLTEMRYRFYIENVTNLQIVFAVDTINNDIYSLEFYELHI